MGLFAFAQQVRALTTPDKSSDVMVKPCSALSVVVRYPMLVSQSKCVVRRYKHASTTS
nr:MAG TPA: hypothetical protein [Caudoviricetes sp.]DAY78885.1 MAG TPA: hypothetical protein [Caudoviricetes sp.]